MDYHAVFIKLYGAAGAALEKLNALGAGVTVPEVVQARNALLEGLAAAESIIEADE